MWGNIYQCDASSSISFNIKTQKMMEGRKREKKLLCEWASHKNFYFSLIDRFVAQFHVEKSSHMERDGIIVNNRSWFSLLTGFS